MRRSLDQKGFSLLELLVVVAILAIIAGALIVSLGGVEDDASLHVARAEATRVRDAVLQFKLDTGYLPKQGPFRLDSQGGSVLGILLPSAAGATDSQKQTWFNSPANFFLLYGFDQYGTGNRSPLWLSGHTLENWNPDTGRGWRGSYLTRQGEGLVDIGDNLGVNGSGSPISGGILSQVRGVADPFVSSPVGSYLVWRSTASGQAHDRWGRPYLLFDLGSDDARVVSMGVDRKYDGKNLSDPCAPPPTGDDVVVCLLR